MFSTILWEGVLLQSISVLLIWSAFPCISSADIETNSVVVKFYDDGSQDPHLIAKRSGYTYKGKVLDGLHHFVRPGNIRAKRSLEYAADLESHPSVEKVFYQQGFTRHKRGFKNLKNEYNEYLQQKTTDSQSWSDFNDPLLPKQWYLKNTGQAGGRPGLDLNVEAAWAKGYTGKGVTIAIMDDGIDYLHPDIAENYNAEASYDFSSDDPLPYPRFTSDWFNSHGTRCAGEVSARANNGICGVGIAYNSKVAGIRMLDQPFMTDLIEASSMSFKPQLIDIYSASWGPQDNGKTVDGPRDLTLDAIADGVNKGRGGKGSIYVWASGDGGPHDDCNCDGYASSMWTISINSAINDGRTALYDESCSSTLASTFSNGRNRNPEAGVATTDLYGNCTLSHSGTSAAAPEAAAVFALALEANPELTWRDIQHLIVLTSKRNQLYDEEYEWKCNGVGLEFNHLFGFGVLDAGAMVTLAEDWTSVPERFHCSGAAYTGVSEVPSAASGERLILKLNTDACENQEGFVRYLEHTQAIVTLNSTRRGDVTIFLTSPMGTRSILLSERLNDDDNTDGFQHWPFMTTHCWGEDPRGEWTLEVAMRPGSYARATLSEWRLVLHGTQEAPYIDGLKSESNCVKSDTPGLYEAKNVTVIDEDGEVQTGDEEEAESPLEQIEDMIEDEEELKGLDLPVDETLEEPSSMYWWEAESSYPAMYAPYYREIIKEYNKRFRYPYK